MSEMVKEDGIVTELYPEEKDLNVKLSKLAKSLGIEEDELFYPKDSEDDYIEFKGNRYKDYNVVGNRLFDTTEVNSQYDLDSDEHEDVKKIGPNKYKIDFYYYNGGTSGTELFSENLEKADNAYMNSSSVEEDLDEIMEDLAESHNFDYAKKQILKWHDENRE